jgi:hypothetical protein
MEWGKEKRKIVFFGTYVLFWYTLEKWRQKVVEIDIKLKEIAKTNNYKKQSKCRCPCCNTIKNHSFSEGQLD